MEEQPQCPSGLPLAASAGTASLLPVSWGCCFPAVMAKDSSRMWPFQFWPLLSSILSCCSLAFVSPPSSCVAFDSPVVSSEAPLWLQAESGHVSRGVRAGLHASTTITKEAPQGMTRRLDTASKAGVRNTLKNISLIWTFPLLRFLMLSGEQAQRPNGICLGAKGWTKTSLLGCTCPYRQQLLFDLPACCCPTCRKADVRCHSGEESGAARTGQGISRDSV